VRDDVLPWENRKVCDVRFPQECVEYVSIVHADGDFMETYVPEELLTVRQHSEQFPYLTEGALRDKIYHSMRRIRGGRLIPPNGLAPAFHWLGRRVYIDPRMLRQLIAAANPSPVGTSPRTGAANG
jgi:hypothetical protein